MSVCMGLVITMDSSEKIYVVYSPSASTYAVHSDDVVAAAWDAGIGVHALIWVSFAHISPMYRP
jgi:hypothetical protein